jgi:peroxiredoxin
MKKLIVVLMLFSASVYAQEKAQQITRQFNATLKVEDEERFYNDLIAKNPADPTNPDQYSEHRAQLAVDWLIKGSIDKYKFYKNTNPKFTALQLFELSNLLEYWVDGNKNIVAVEQISGEILHEIESKLHDDTFGRIVPLLEVNAMSNARLGNIDLAMRNIEKSTALKSPFRQMAYFRNSTANYLNRYGFILSAAGQHHRALDTLTKAASEALSTPMLIGTLKEVYQKVNGGTKGMDKYVASLQNEAYQKIYKEVEKAWISKTKKAPDVTLIDMNGKAVKLSDYKGKIVVIDFWSTACKPCVAAFPAFERIVDFYKKESFQLFVINEGETPDIVKPYMNKKGYKLDVLFDHDEAIFKALDALGTPQKFIIDANGNINQTGIGYAGSDDKEFYKLKAMIELTKARSSGKSVVH